MGKSTKRGAADLQGVGGLYVPEAVTDILVNEVYTNSTIQNMANSDWTAESLGLDCAEIAHYNILEDVDLTFKTKTNHDFNGEKIEIPNPFRNGTLTMCHEILIQNKFSRNQAIRQCGQWEEQQRGYEITAANLFSRTMDVHGYRVLAASAEDYNIGNDAGARSGNIKLGDAVNPLVLNIRDDLKITDFQTTAIDVVSRLLTVASEAGLGAAASRLRLAGSARFVHKLRDEQARMGLGGGCCLKENPAISGTFLDAYGLPAMMSDYLPYKRLQDGSRIEYVILGNPETIAAPHSLDYFEWEKVLGDIYLIGNFRFNVQALSAKNLFVAAVKY